MPGGPIELAEGDLRCRERRQAAGFAEYETGDDVRCVIPGYDQPGRELVAEELTVHDDPFSWELTGELRVHE